MLHNKYKSCGPHCFLKFFYITSLWKLLIPGAVPLSSRIYVGDIVAYQIYKLWALWFQKKIFKVFPIISLWELYVAMAKPNAAFPAAWLCFTWNLIQIGQLIFKLYYFESVDGRWQMDGRRRTIAILIPHLSLQLGWANIIPPSALLVGNIKRPDQWVKIYLPLYLCSLELCEYAHARWHRSVISIQAKIPCLQSVETVAWSQGSLQRCPLLVLSSAQWYMHA